MELNIKDMTAEQIADAKAQIEAWEARIFNDEHKE